MLLSPHLIFLNHFPPYPLCFNNSRCVQLPPHSMPQHTSITVLMMLFSLPRCCHLHHPLPLLTTSHLIPPKSMSLYLHELVWFPTNTSFRNDYIHSIFILIPILPHLFQLSDKYLSPKLSTNWEQKLGLFYL